jgi:predicted nucleic-acid-binding Zn-ribbon protein
VTELRQKLCGWNEQYSDEVQTPQQEMEAVCPKCGGETYTFKAGV